MAFSYEWKKLPVLYDTQERLCVQSKGNAAMCLALHDAKEKLSDALGLDGMLAESTNYLRDLVSEAQIMVFIITQNSACFCSGGGGAKVAKVP